MKKWNDLRDILITALVQAEAGDQEETAKVLRTALEQMDKLDKKYYKARKEKFKGMSTEDLIESFEARDAAWLED